MSVFDVECESVKRPVRVVSAAFACAAVLAFASGCSDDDNDSPSTKASKSASTASKSASAAASAVCMDLQRLKEDTDKLTAMDPATASKDDVKNAVDQVTQDLADVSSASGDLGTAASAAVTAAAAAAKAAVQSVGDNASAQQTLDALKKPLETLSGTLSSVRGGLNCPSASPSPS